MVKLAYQQIQNRAEPKFELTEAWLVANGY